jgi:uncharacterized NAD(P)/FAD-binding protein YdhS
LWQSLSADDQRRFMRHARPWWDVHRHRIAPQVGAVIERMIGDGRLEVLAGRIEALRAGPSTSSGRAGPLTSPGRAGPLTGPGRAGPSTGPGRADGQGIEAVIRRRGAAEADPPRHFAVGINCTGPLHAIRHTRDPLLRSLLDAGLATPDHLGIGLTVDDGVRVIGADGAAAQRLWAMGSLGKARYWEIIAVPDIRVQAEQVATAIAEELSDDA